MFSRRLVLRVWAPALIAVLGIALIVVPLTVSGHKSSTSPSTATGGVPPARTSDNFRLGTATVGLRGKEGPGLAVDPANPRHVVEVDLDMLAGECEFNTSTDGGTTWAGDRLHAPTGFPEPGASPCSVTAGAPMDSSVAFGSGQNVYTAWASASVASKNHAALVSRSTDGGRTFATATVAMPEGTTPKAGTVKPGPDYAAPKLAVAKGAGANGADRVVMEAVDGGCRVTTTCAGNLFVATSDDAGATWSAPVQVNAPLDTAANPFGVAEATQIVVGPSGHLFVGWRTNPTAFASQNPNLALGFIRVAQSADTGKTWTVNDATPVRGSVYTGPVTPPFARTPTAFGCCAFPRLAINPSSGTLFLVWNQGPGLYDPVTGAVTGPTFTAADHFINPQSDVWVMSSPDGVTWSGRHQVNDSPVAGVATQTRHPNVSVAPDGRVDIVWQDRRDWYRGCTATHVACSEARLGDTYYASSTDGAKTFSPNRRITDRAMNNDVGFDYRYGTYWDFGPVSVPTGASSVLVAWMDSREGSHTNDDQDIYLAQTPVTPGGVIPVKALAAPTGDDLSVALSRLADPGGSEGVLASTFATRPATSVVIANDHDAAALLAGGVLARANLGPLLASPPGGLPAAVKAEVSRMDPIGAFVVGSPAQLSPQVVSDLASAGVPADKIVRLDGGNAAATAALVAAAMDRRTDTDKAANLPAFDAVVIARADSPDAVAASTLAVSRRLPVLYVDAGGVPSATTEAIANLHVSKALVIGGTSVVGDAVLAALTTAGVAPTRLGGADAQATSMAVLRESIQRGLPANQVFVANGDNPLQGAMLGASTGRIGALLVLTKGGSTAQAQSMLGGVGLTQQVARIIVTSASTW